VKAVFERVRVSVSESKDAPIAALGPLYAGLAIAHLVGLGITIGIAHLAGWSSASGFGITGSAVLGMIAVAIGTACGLAALYSPSSRSLRNIGPRVMFSSAARMIVALASVLIFFFLTQNQPHALFVALLACGILALIVETVWSITALRRVQAAAASSLPHSDSHGARSA
jgi:hypothetical protein